MIDEEKEDYLLSFAKHNFTEYFFENVSGCLKKVNCDGDRSFIEEVVEPALQNVISASEFTGGMSYDECEFLGVDILVPNCIEKEIKLFTSYYLDIEMRVSDAESILKHVERERDIMGIPDHFLMMLNTAIEKRYILTISE